MATVAVLGMGLLGVGFAQSLVEKGHTVRVWNRTAAKCAPAVAMGAVQASDPADAVRGADRVHLVLTADDAVDAVIAQLAEALPADAPVVDHSTNLPARVAQRSAVLRARGVRYLHAPVFMGPAHSRSATGLMLIAGETGEVEALRPALEAMTGRLWHVGETPEKAAGLKIVGNGMLLVLTAGMGDMFRIGAGAGLTPDEVLGLFETFGPSAAGMGRRVLADGPVGFELAMARKDAGLMIDTAGDTLTVIPAIAAAMDRAIADGLGQHDFTYIAKA